jgi:hypothetical protein
MVWAIHARSVIRKMMMMSLIAEDIDHQGKWGLHLNLQSLSSPELGYLLWNLFNKYCESRKLFCNKKSAKIFEVFKKISNLRWISELEVKTKQFLRVSNMTTWQQLKWFSVFSIFFNIIREKKYLILQTAVWEEF